MTRDATNTTTATNYALEGEIKDKPSVQVIPGNIGENGPWQELIPDRNTSLPDIILTKTHCIGFCAGRRCGSHKTIQTVRSFMTGCAEGTRAVVHHGKLETHKVWYDPALVVKAIHLIRHPLHNIVARYHLFYDLEVKNSKKYSKIFQKDAPGFRRWCEQDDANNELLRSRYIDAKLRAKLVKIPCFNDFFRYVQWHNNAFSLARDMELPVLILHYEEYSENFEKARDKVLDFLGLSLVGSGVEFYDGKVYHDYYSTEEKTAIKEFIQEFASADTWQRLKDYDFEDALVKPE
jgi:hypothetical protein